MITKYHAKYYSNLLTGRSLGGDIDTLSQSLFVGSISAVVRNHLWKLITESGDAGGAVLLYSAQNEQGFCIEMHGDPRRKVVDFDGLSMIQTS